MLLPKLVVYVHKLNCIFLFTHNFDAKITVRVEGLL